MRIESARDLKTEILARLPGGDSTQHDSLAVGIAPGVDGEFRLAVRVVSPRHAAMPVFKKS